MHRQLQKDISHFHILGTLISFNIICRILTLSKSLFLWLALHGETRDDTIYVHEADCLMGKDGYCLENRMSNSGIIIKINSVKERHTVLRRA